MDTLNALLEQFLKLEALVPATRAQRQSLRFSPTSPLDARTLRAGTDVESRPELDGDMVEIEGAFHVVFLAVTLDMVRILVTVPLARFRDADDATLDLGALATLAYVLPDGAATFTQPANAPWLEDQDRVRAYRALAALEGEDPKTLARRDVAARLAKAQKSAGLTDDELAAAAGLAPERLRSILLGQGAPRKDVLAIQAALVARGVQP